MNQCWLLRGEAEQAWTYGGVDSFRLSHGLRSMHRMEDPYGSKITRQIHGDILSKIINIGGSVCP